MSLTLNSNNWFKVTTSSLELDTKLQAFQVLHKHTIMYRGTFHTHLLGSSIWNYFACILISGCNDEAGTLINLLTMISEIFRVGEYGCVQIKQDSIDKYIELII